MRIISNYFVLWLSLAGVLVTIGVYYNVGADGTTFLVNSLLLGVATTISLSWFHAARRALARGANDGIGKIVLTVWLGWTSVAISRLYAAVYLWLDRPTWLRDMPINAITLSLIVVAGLYAALAPLSGPRESPEIGGYEIRNVSRSALTGLLLTAVSAAAYLVRNGGP